MNLDPIRDEAMAWRVRHQAGALSSRDQAAFDAWLAQSRDHQTAYAGVDEFWTAVGRIDQHHSYAEIRRRAEAVLDRGRFTRRAIAASLAAAVIALGGLGVYLKGGPAPLSDQSFRTAVGQQATVTLPDGSQVTLNTDTVVSTRAADDGRRLVHLEKGQAYFKVAKDPRHPFVVSAAGRTVTALGTAFDVRIDGGELRVVLVEGTVRVAATRPTASAQSPTKAAPPAKPISTIMTAGSQLVAPDDAEWRLVPANARRATSWTKGQLVFDDEALGDIVEELNRYSTRQIVLADSRLAEHRLSGNFTPGDVDGFARMLRTGDFATLREHANGEIEIVPLQ